MRSIRRLAFLAAALIAPLAACDNPEQAVHIAPKQPRADRATTIHGVTFAQASDELTASERQRLSTFVRELPPDRTTTVTLLTAPGSPLQAQRTAAVRSYLQ